VEISRLNKQPNPQGTFGKSIFHGSFHNLITFWAIADIDYMFCYERLNFGNILGEARSARDWLSERREALRALGKGMVFSFMDHRRCGSSDSLMTLFSARLFLPPFTRRLLINRSHPRGNRRIIFRQLFFQLLHLSIKFKEFFYRGLLTGAV
jgi:hypothetical protein